MSTTNINIGYVTIVFIQRGDRYDGWLHFGLNQLAHCIFIFYVIMVTGHDSHEPSAKAFNESMKEKVDFKAKFSIICKSFDLISTFLCQLLLHATASNLDRTHRIFPPCHSSGRSIPVRRCETRLAKDHKLVLYAIWYTLSYWIISTFNYKSFHHWPEAKIYRMGW